MKNNFNHDDDLSSWLYQYHKKIGRAGECAESCQQQKCYVWHANKEEGCLRG